MTRQITDNTMKIKNKKPVVKKPGNDDKRLWIVVGVTTLALAGVGYWYYRKRQKEAGMSVTMEDLDREIAQTVLNNTLTRSNPQSTTRPTRFRCSSSGYPLQYGTCHKDVKVLQSYLHKIYKADLGRSGRNKNGVDGMFGSKTSRAAKKYLQKTAFSKKDIDGMKTANKTIKR